MGPRSAVAVLAAFVVVALALPAAPAVASPQQESIFMDDNLLLYRGDAVADRTLAELAALGVDRVRVSLHWRAFAPAHRAAERPASFTDPADPAQYDERVFDAHDHLLRAAAAAGIGVLVNVTGGAPLWATGRLNGQHVGLQYKPDPRAFGAFVRMLGRRYDGRHRDTDQGGARLPRVDTWSIWNEPNQGALLQPQWELRDGFAVAASPRLYRGLARAALAALARTGHARDTILLGETAPRGVERRTRTGSIRPVAFLASLLCLDRATLAPLDAAAAAADGCDFATRGVLAVSGYAHHPYSVVSAPSEPDLNPDDVTLADRDRLAGVLDAAAIAGRLPTGLPLWFTEFGWQTLPPDPIRGVSLDDQARWIAEAERQTWADPRVAAMAQFLLRDDTPRSGPGISRARRWSTYQTGLEFSDGRHKPAYAAYRLPLVAPSSVPEGRPLTLWGMVRPAAAGDLVAVQLEFKPVAGRAFAPVGGPVAVGDQRGYFQATVVPPASGTWRFEWSPPDGGSALASPAVGVRVGGVR